MSQYDLNKSTRQILNKLDPLKRHYSLIIKEALDKEEKEASASAGIPQRIRAISQAMSRPGIQPQRITENRPVTILPSW